MATILIVDDSSEVSVALMATLEDAGHTVREASDGRDAVEQATLIQSDAIILDINSRTLTASPRCQASAQTPSHGTYLCPSHGIPIR